MKRLCGIALLAILVHQVRPAPKNQQQDHLFNSEFVESLKDKDEIGGEIMSGNLRESTCIDVSPNCHLNIDNCLTSEFVQGRCRKSCGLCGGCHAEFNSNNGTIRYPLNGGNYPNNADLCWIIRATQPIKITFTRFEVEQNYDVLYVQDGEINDLTVLGNFTGYDIPSPVDTTGDSAYLRFISDYSVTKTGFELHWEQLGCGGEYVSSIGIIRHPSNQVNYKNEENCIWVIRTSVPIVITFVSFDTQQNHDYLYVRNSIGSKLLGNLTGTVVPSQIQISTNKAFLQFTSDHSVTSTGFVLQWKPSGSDCGGNHIASCGMIRHPNYQNYEKCIWRIKTSDPITITFVSFDTESTYDYLYVRDGESIGAVVVGNFSGDSIPSPIQTTSNEAYLLFTSDQSVTSTGFELRWEPSTGSDCECKVSKGLVVASKGGQCLTTFRDKYRTWIEARDKCLSHGLQLAKPRDAVAVRKYIVENYGNGYTWVGAQGNGANMKWVGNQGVLPNDSDLWYPGCPNNEVFKNDCLRLLTYSDIMSNLPVQPYASWDCSAVKYTLCEEA